MSEIMPGVYNDLLAEIDEAIETAAEEIHRDLSNSDIPPDEVARMMKAAHIQLDVIRQMQIAKTDAVLARHLPLRH